MTSKILNILSLHNFDCTICNKSINFHQVDFGSVGNTFFHSKCADEYVIPERRLKTQTHEKCIVCNKYHLVSDINVTKIKLIRYNTCTKCVLPPMCECDRDVVWNTKKGICDCCIDEQFDPNTEYCEYCGDLVINCLC